MILKIKGRFRVVVLILAVGLFGVAFSRAQVLADGDFYGHAMAGAKALQNWYNPHGLWDSTGWWNAANCLDGMESIIVANNGQEYLDVIPNTYKRNSRKNFLNEYYDDEGWWALAWIRAYDLTGESRYLRMAKKIFKNMKGGWDDHCGGGIWWRKDRHYKNAIANELFMSVAVRLSERTPEDEGVGSYLDWALRDWTWFKQTGMINSRELVNDGLDVNCQNNHHTTWTYNQGVLIGGLTELYKVTGDPALVSQANALAEASLGALVNRAGVLHEPHEDRGLHGEDVAQFKGIFVRYVAELYEVTGNPALHDFLVANARSIWSQDRNDKDQFGGRWAGPIDTVDAARQSSALSVFTALAGTVTTNGPIAAGEAVFLHDVGRPDGHGNWTANSLQDHASGFLTHGPVQNLTPGASEARFELKVDNFNRDNARVATISVWDVDTQTTIAERDLKRHKFPNILYQTFALRFNAVAGHHYDFRTFWHRSPSAPWLTQRCVVINSG